MPIHLSYPKERRRKELIEEFFRYVPKIPRPPCFKCKHKVPSINVDWDDQQNDMVIELKCHNESEYVRIPVKLMDQISKIEIGWAFHPKEAELQEGKSIKELH